MGEKARNILMSGLGSDADQYFHTLIQLSINETVRNSTESKSAYISAREQMISCLEHSKTFLNIVTYSVDLSRQQDISRCTKAFLDIPNNSR